MKAHIHLLQHSIGLDEYGKGRQFRNHFVTGPGSKDWDGCRSLVEAGLMVEREGHNLLTGGDSVFHVTPAGIDFVAFNSLQIPNLSRSQRRYRAYLDSETSLTFAEYIGVRS